MEISKGDRVQGRKHGKTGTAVRDQHETMTGHAVYVRWDGDTRPALPTNIKNIVKLEG